MPLERTRLALILIGCALAAAIAIAGPIDFVALVIPQVARMLTGPMTGGTILLTAALGAGYLLLSDVVAFHFFSTSRRRYADLIVAMKAGAIAAAGSPERVVTPAFMRDVFGVDAEIGRDPGSGAPLVMPRYATSSLPSATVRYAPESMTVLSA